MYGAICFFNFFIYFLSVFPQLWLFFFTLETSDDAVQAPIDVRRRSPGDQTYNINQKVLYLHPVSKTNTGLLYSSTNFTKD